MAGTLKVSPWLLSEDVTPLGRMAPHDEVLAAYRRLLARPLGETTRWEPEAGWARLRRVVGRWRTTCLAAR